MSRGFAEEETHDVCKVCDYAIRNEECPGCGFSFESFSIKEHDAAIRKQTIEECLAIVKFYENQYDGICWAIRDLEQMKGEADD